MSPRDLEKDGKCQYLSWKSVLFRQHAASTMALGVSLFCPKRFYATSKQGRRIRCGMLTDLTNIISTKVLW